MKKIELQDIFRELYSQFGPQYWWPGDSQLEIMVGAILTQNTSWQNVEKAIQNIRAEGFLSLEKLSGLKIDELAGLIRPSGYYNIKATRLRELLVFIKTIGGIHSLEKEDPFELRAALLGIRGVGDETADSILLYALGHPFFVVDAYTKRIFSRLGFIEDYMTYTEVQQFFEANLPRDTSLFNEYHALIVRLGKETCTKSRPKCMICPINRFCEYYTNLSK